MASNSPQSHPNDEAIAVWQEIVGPKYVRFRHTLAAGFGAHGDAALARCPVEPGERVVEVGCGLGERAADLAMRTGPAGSVVAIDTTQRFLEIARAEAEAAGIANLRYVEADVERSLEGGPFDLAFSQFGTMFFANPAVALRNIRRVLRPGGRLLMVVWRGLEENLCFSLPQTIVERHLPKKPDGAPTCGPGPFSMADPERVLRVLSAAGFEDAQLRPINVPLLLGQTLNEAIEFQLSLGPAGERMRLAADLPDLSERRARIETDLGAALRAYIEADGVRLPSSSWCVFARASWAM